MVILIIIIFIIILLFIGIRISLSYTKKGSDFQGCFTILVLRKIKVISRSYPSPDDDEEVEEEEEDENSSINVREILDLARPCLNDIKLFLKSILKAFNIKKLQNHLIFGLDSFADTGEYIGIIWAFLAVANSTCENAQLTAEPSFQGSVLDSWGEAEFDMNILKLVIPAVRLLLKKDVRNLIKGVRNGR